MGQRVRKAHRGQSPSSARQLPILAALHARFPTLFQIIIHDIPKKVNSNFPNPGVFSLGKNSFVDFDEISLKKHGKTLAFCAILLYNDFNSGQGGKERG